MRLRLIIQQAQKLKLLILINVCFLAELLFLVGIVTSAFLHSRYPSNSAIVCWSILTILTLVAYTSVTIYIVKKKHTSLALIKSLHKNNFVVDDIMENFVSAGYIFYNSQMQIVYMSKYVTKKFGDDLYGKLITDLAPDIAANRNRDLKVSLRKNSQYYKLIFLAKYRIILIKDDTVFQKSVGMLNNNLQALIIFNLSNLDEALELMTEQQKINYLYRTTCTILAFCKKYNMFLIKPTPSQFLVITNLEHMNNIIFNREFKRIFLDFNKSQKDTKFAVELSIAGAYGLNNLNILYEDTLKNLHICTSRGGNQAIITNCITKEIFMSEGEHIPEIAASVLNIKSLAHTLQHKIKRASNVVIMGHKNLDFDCLGAGLGLIELCKLYNKKARFVIDEDTISVDYSKIIKKYFPKAISDEIFVANKKVMQSKFYNSTTTLLIIIDVSTQKLFDNAELFQATKNFHIIDHHHLPITEIEKKQNYFIDPNISSTCEIVINLLNLQLQKNQRLVKLPDCVPIFLYMGLYIDTNDFKNKTTSATFSAAAILKNWGLDQTKINNILQINKTSFKMIVELKSHFEEPIRDILICCDSGKSRIYQRHEIAITCDELLLRRNSLLTVVIAYVGKNMVGASLRSSNQDINVQQIAESCGGGGSKSSAAILKRNTTPAELRKKIVSILKNEVIKISEVI